jgi:hypothetical protein
VAGLKLSLHSNLQANANLSTSALKTNKGTYRLSLKWNWNKLLVIFAPLCPLNTNMDSRATATGKLQQVGGQSPACVTSSHALESPWITASNNVCMHTWRLNSVQHKLSYCNKNDLSRWRKKYQTIALWDIVPYSLTEVDWHFRGVYCLHQHLDNEGSMHLLKVGLLKRDYAALYHTKLSSSYSLLWESEISEEISGLRMKNKIWHSSNYKTFKNGGK